MTTASDRLRFNFLHEGERTEQYGDGSDVIFQEDLRAVLRVARAAQAWAKHGECDMTNTNDPGLLLLGFKARGELHDAVRAMEQKP